jgi:hypothetical protein
MRHTMNKRLFSMLWIAGLVCLMSCNNNKPGPSVKNSSDSLLIPFVPPWDSVITRDQMGAWFDCNPKLDSLSMIFTASLTNGKAPDESSVSRFSRTQDTICAKCGLQGGYTQYFWITQHLGSKVNRPCYDSVATQRAKQKKQ